MARGIKIFSQVSCTGLGFHLLFRQEYHQMPNGDDHCLVGTQRWYNRQVDAFLGIENRPEKKAAPRPESISPLPGVAFDQKRFPKPSAAVLENHKSTIPIDVKES
jgi:hypothetical protein